MKALSKAAEDRYQSGQDLVNDLERCKESAAKGVARKPAQPAQGLNAAAQKAAAPASEESKSVTAKARPSSAASAPAQSAQAEVAPASAKAVAAAAGWESAGAPSTVELGEAGQSAQPARASGQSAFQERASAVAETVEPASETPAFQVDPSMAEEAKKAARGPSFSEMTELPPLKEVYIAPPPPPAASRAGTRAGSVVTSGAARETQGAAAGSGAQGSEGNQEDPAQAVPVFDRGRDSCDSCWWWGSSRSASIPKIPRTRVQRQHRQRPRPWPPRSLRGTRLSRP